MGVGALTHWEDVEVGWYWSAALGQSLLSAALPLRPSRSCRHTVRLRLLQLRQRRPGK